MLWDSTAIMTAIDLVLLVGTGFVIASLIRYRRYATSLGVNVAVAMIALGVLAIGLFYTLDLVTTWITPQLGAEPGTSAMMTSRAENGRKAISLLEVALIGGGLFYLINRLIPGAAAQFDRLETTIEKRTRELERANQALQAEVHERTRAQQELEKNRRELEFLVESRTAELEESRAALVRSERLASLGTLTAGVAHEINNPIGAILNAAEYAMLCADEEQGTEEAHRAIAVSIREARRCGEIVRGLLTFQRHDPGKQAMADLGQILGEVIADSQAYAAGKRVSLTLEPAAKPMYAYVNPTGIEQVFTNLVRNAIEASESGGRIRIEGRHEDEGLCFEFRDSGRGIGSDDLGQIFDPFFTTRQERGGTGLGLSIAHGIIASHDGRIEVESTLGRGSVFRVWVPMEGRNAERMRNAELAAVA